MPVRSGLVTLERVCLPQLGKVSNHIRARVFYGVFSSLQVFITVRLCVILHLRICTSVTWGQVRVVIFTLQDYGNILKCVLLRVNELNQPILSGLWQSILSVMPVPVSQLVERSAPCGESTRPGFKSPRVRGATGAWYLWASWRVCLRLVAGRSGVKSVRGPAVRGYVRTLNIRL